MARESLPYSLPVGTTREWHGCMLTLTEEGWRAEVKHSMHRRCRGWDYCRPWIYMITIDTQHHDIAPMPQIDGYKLPEWLQRQYAKKGHPHLFGELADSQTTGCENRAAASDSEGKPMARIALNTFGQEVDKHIREIPKYHPQVSIIEYVVMPNHIHFIIKVKERLPEKKPLGEIVKGFKTAVGQCFKELVLGVPAATRMNVVQPSSSQTASERTGAAAMSARLAVAMSARLEASRAKYGGHGPKNPKVGLVFESGFHDRILFRSGQLQTMIKYVRSNPQRLWEVVHNRRYFEKMAGWRITMPLLPDGGTRNAGRWWNYYPGGTEALMSEDGVRGLLAKVEIDTRIANGCEHETPSTLTMTFNAIGNRELLAVPERMQIQCSRRMTQANIDLLIQDVLEACEHGVVAVSPCISPGEKQVARAVMEAGYQLIVLFPNGIPPQTDEYKPYGVYFEACARGQLLILSPWEFYAGQTKLSRWQCLMLNDIAAQLSIM